jgi:hypothetical protein
LPIGSAWKLLPNGLAFDVNAEVNNGRGPVEYKISVGKANAGLVEFKLARNTSLEMNLRNPAGLQVADAIMQNADGAQDEKKLCSKNSKNCCRPKIKASRKE